MYGNLFKQNMIINFDVDNDEGLEDNDNTKINLKRNTRNMRPIPLIYDKEAFFYITVTNKILMELPITVSVLVALYLKLSHHPDTGPFWSQLVSKWGVWS